MKQIQPKRLKPIIKKSYTEVLNTVCVIGGVGRITDLKWSVKFPLDLEDGLYQLEGQYLIPSNLDEYDAATEKRRLLTVNDYPVLPARKKEKCEKIELKVDINQLSILNGIIAPEMKFSLAGIGLNPGEIASTDGHRLAIIRVKIDYKGKDAITLNSKPLERIMRVFKVQEVTHFYRSENNYFFEFDSEFGKVVEISIKIIDQKYPNYSAVIPTGKLRKYFNIKDLQGLPGVFPKVKSTKHHMYIEQKNEVVTLWVPDIAIQTLYRIETGIKPIQHNDFEFACEYNFFLHMLSCMDHGVVESENLNDNDCTLKVDDGKMLYLIMPVDADLDTARKACAKLGEIRIVDIKLPAPKVKKPAAVPRKPARRSPSNSEGAPSLDDASTAAIVELKTRIARLEKEKRELRRNLHYKKITARFQGVCEACRKVITRGQEVFYSPVTKKVNCCHAVAA
jgi:hypothetical protein